MSEQIQSSDREDNLCQAILKVERTLGWICYWLAILTVIILVAAMKFLTA